MTERRKLLEQYKDKSDNQLKEEHLLCRAEIDDLRERQRKEATENDRHWYDLEEQIQEIMKRVRTIERVWFYRNREPMPYTDNDE